jgi:drug/metabolite transporter (DMT)-like permease
LPAGTLDALGNLRDGRGIAAHGPVGVWHVNGFRPALALLFGWLFLRETPTSLGGIGVGVTVIGTAMLLRDEKSEKANGIAWQMFGLRVAGLALSTFASVFLKRATLLGGPELTLGVWILCGLPVFWLWSSRKVETSL